PKLTSACLSCFVRRLRPPTPPLFPYTTLFRSPAFCRNGLAIMCAPTAETKVPTTTGKGNTKPTSTVPRSVPSAESAAGRIFWVLDRKSTRLNSSHVKISYAVFCLKKKKNDEKP